MIQIDLKGFHKSTSKELEALKNRVRNLIGKSNWTDEGKYKEIVLSNVINRFLPEKFNIASGHVVAKERGVTRISNQIDLIIYDTSYPVLFKQGDFIIITASGVRGIIEVKTNIKNVNFKTVIDKANVNGRFVWSYRSVVPFPLFNGVFSYEGYEKGYPNNIKIDIKTSALAHTDNLQDANSYLVNNICLNKKYFIRYNKHDARSYKMYNLPQLSFSYFVGNLVNYLMKDRDIEIEKEKAIWFPIDKGQHTEWTISLDN